MNIQFILFILKRYLRFDKEQPFIFLSAMFAFLGIAVGVMVLIIAMAIMNGFDKEFEKKLFTMNNPITIYPKVKGATDVRMLHELERNFEQMKFSPFVQTQVIAKKGEKMQGGVLFGVDFERAKAINEILANDIDVEVPKFGLIAGRGIYEELLLYPSEKLSLIFSTANPNGLNITPTIKRFSIKGYFESGLSAYDSTYMYTTLEALRVILNKEADSFDGIHVYSDNPMEDIKEIEQFLQESHVLCVGWWQQNGNFFLALELEKKALFIVLMLIILVASLNIIGSLLMTVMNRRKEIALMLTLGVSTKEIGRIFFYLGSIIGASGILTGIILGFTGLYILSTFDIITLYADIYPTSKLPLDLDTQDFLMVIVGSSIISLLSSYYPAKKATKINPIEILRNE